MASAGDAFLLLQLDQCTMAKLQAIFVHFPSLCDDAALCRFMKRYIEASWDLGMLQSSISKDIVS